MKKTFSITLGILLVIAILIFFFQKDLIATGLWLYLSINSSKNPIIYQVPSTEVLRFEREDSYPTKKFENVVLPVIFTEPTLREGSSTIAVLKQSENKTYFISKDIDYIESHHEACTIYNGSKGIEWCASNQEFYTNLLSLHPDDVGLFSPKQEKIALSTLLMLKSLLISEGTIAPYESNYTKGFLIQGTNETDIASVYGNNDEMYTIVFFKMSLEEIEQVLANITLIE